MRHNSQIKLIILYCIDGCSQVTTPQIMRYQVSVIPESTFLLLCSKITYSHCHPGNHLPLLCLYTFWEFHTNPTIWEYSMQLFQNIIYNKFYWYILNFLKIESYSVYFFVPGCFHLVFCMRIFSYCCMCQQFVPLIAG